MNTILTDENFEKEIQNIDKPVLVDFFATWCEPCKILGPIIENVADGLKDKIVLIKINIDDAPLTAQKFNIDRIPTVMLFKNGKTVDSFTGLMSEHLIKEWVENNLNKNQETVENNTQKTKEEFIAKSDEYAEKNGFQLNPDKKTVERVVNGLFENEKKHGNKYCPCRRVTGDPEKDSQIICPCIYHLEELKKDGRCFCGLFTKKN